MACAARSITCCTPVKLELASHSCRMRCKTAAPLFVLPRLLQLTWHGRAAVIPH